MASFPTDPDGNATAAAADCSEKEPVRSHAVGSGLGPLSKPASSRAEAR
jgi:hypothetical protein